MCAPRRNPLCQPCGAVRVRTAVPAVLDRAVGRSDEPYHGPGLRVGQGGRSTRRNACPCNRGWARAMSSALVVIGVVLLVSLALGIIARRGHTMSLEHW